MNGNESKEVAVGRFAPSPTGRMHLGNVFTALMSWLSVRSKGGRWVLRIEDLDPQRSRLQYARQIEDDLAWLGLDWDEGGIDGVGISGPYCQSMRGEIYDHYLDSLMATGLTYPCFCTRADIMATQAPHQSDGRVVYAGTCRPSVIPSLGAPEPSRPHAIRLYVPDEDIVFDDAVCGRQSVNLSRHCGDFVLRRADGAWAYQLAVVVDDALMGVTEVVRGNDLLLSSASQIYLCRLLGFTPPEYVHLPLVCNESGVRLSKRDRSMSMEELRRRYTARELVGLIAGLSGLADGCSPCSPADLVGRFDPALFADRQKLVVG